MHPLSLKNRRKSHRCGHRCEFGRRIEPAPLYYKLVKVCFDSKDLGARSENRCFAEFLGDRHNFLAAFGDSVVKRSGNFPD